MKVSIGARIQQGPWGGGNQVAALLSQHLQQQGHDVSFDLTASDLDLVLLFEPRGRLRISAYTDRHILRYLRRVNPRAVVVHRVNECDERKSTRYVNDRLRCANLCADHTVFVSSWLRELHLAGGWPTRSTSVILNGSDPALFCREGFSPWAGEGPLRLVTHHWGSAWEKGFDIYQRLDQMMAEGPFRDRIALTYIGNLPDGFAFRNARHVTPLGGAELAAELRRHHAYVTGSRNEPGPNHQNEGALSGLPLLYIENASMPEYCRGFGVGYTPETLEAGLAQLLGRYAELVEAMPAYPHTSAKMLGQWEATLTDLVARRDELLAARDPRRVWRWRWLAVAQGRRRDG